jgi:dual specificity tyrosine-phosphorylation-regulated kinase 2/3/4
MTEPSRARVSLPIHPPPGQPLRRRFIPKPPIDPPAIRSARPFPSSARAPQQPQQSGVIPNAPWSPSTVLQAYSSALSPDERREILNFPEIFYIGRADSKPDRSNYDDHQHNYRIVIGDHLAYRFEIVRVFGKGAFGQVIQCIDHKTHSHVAVKVIVNTEQMHEQGQIEARILGQLNALNSKYIVRAFDFFIFRSHICITFEILGKNLYELSQMQRFRPMPMPLCQNWAKQILIGLEQCHALKIVHCDLKPENILVTSRDRNQVKLIDFGSSCTEGHQKYEYIQSRFYRAPEVMLGIPYGPPMDIWSFVLIIIEMLIGTPLFPGDDELEQLVLIAEIFGPPPLGLIRKGKRSKDYFEESNYLKGPFAKAKPPGSIRLETALSINDPCMIDFVKRCLTWDQTERMTASECLQHPFISSHEFEILPKDSKPTLPRIRP